ncbi:InlB B-repeat-containing protein [Dethiobacter alkaliphilus]|uniref:InlB B-repeat-containing protein n=1 Tax=Dethiobacter alkaliphilus TaxID=427926 RepID=UPI0022268A97|nr:InlB B-repeat-containing protein [Dethiobacter alkaliphilus]MCW3491002.1 InlB B-repeat-containing protein [Dethiobacter alkaliphilus]
MLRKLVSVLLIAALVFGIMPTGLHVYGEEISSDPDNFIFAINEGNILIASGCTGLKVVYGDGQEKDDIDVGQNITIIGATTAYGVTVEGVAANITIDNLNINTSNSFPFRLRDGADVDFTLVGENSLSSDSRPGLTVDTEDTITIDGEGFLTATGSDHGAGIGGYWGSGGTINISGGTITATGGREGAGIGGGFAGSGGTINISGGTVTATGGFNGAGIGGGNNGSGGTININGGTITATGGREGAGIGGGLYGGGGTINISGGNVTARSGNCGGSGIGRGCVGSGGSIDITGGSVKAFAVGSGTGINASAINIDAAAELIAASAGFNSIANNLQASSSASILAANYWNIVNPTVSTSIYDKDGLELYTDFAPDFNYRSIAFTVPSDKTYYLKKGETYKQHSWSTPSADFVIGASGLFVFDNITDAFDHPATRQDQEAPTDLAAIAPTTSADNDGKLIGVDSNMEYKAAEATEWNSITATEVTGLAPGDYEVRYKYIVGYNPSPSTVVTVPEGYSVNFNSNGGNTVPSQFLKYNSLIGEPTAPKKTGYTFIGWYSEEELTTAWDFAADKVPAEDITLYAGWDINEYTVSLDSRGGSAADSITAEYGSMISEPPAPEKAGYTFEGWYTDESLEVAWDFVEDTVPASDITLYAKWEISTYNVTFKDWDGSILKAETIEYGSSATAPAAPTKTGYTFSGWDTGFGNITSNLSVTAEYEQNAVSPSVSVVSERVQTKVKGLDEAVDVSEDLAAGKDVEIALELDLLTVETVPEEDREAINSKLTSEPFGEGVKSFYLDISLFKILREEGAETREKLSETASFIAITLTIPEDQRGGTDYRVLRVHDGVAEYLDTIYDSDNYTLTFETDRFSTYAIAYTPPGEAPVEETQDEQDEEQGKLPETGLNNWILIILGLVLIMAGIVLQRRYAETV